MYNNLTTSEVALSGGHSISQEEVEELKAYLDKLQPYEEI